MLFTVCTENIRESTTIILHLTFDRILILQNLIQQIYGTLERPWFECFVKLFTNVALEEGLLLTAMWWDFLLIYVRCNSFHGIMYFLLIYVRCRSKCGNVTFCSGKFHIMIWMTEAWSMLAFRADKKTSDSPNQN